MKRKTETEELVLKGVKETASSLQLQSNLGAVGGMLVSWRPRLGGQQ